MEVNCPRCRTRHLIDPPSPTRARTSRSLKFRCTSCGFTFAVPVDASEAPAPQPDPRGRTTPPAGVQQWVKVDEEIFPLGDLATLQRWILERRVTREDRWSTDGRTWLPLTDRSDLLLFFSAADQLVRAEPAPRPPEDEQTVLADAAPRAAPPADDVFDLAASFEEPGGPVDEPPTEVHPALADPADGDLRLDDDLHGGAATLPVTLDTTPTLSDDEQTLFVGGLPRVEEEPEATEFDGYRVGEDDHTQEEIPRGDTLFGGIAEATAELPARVGQAPLPVRFEAEEGAPPAEGADDADGPFVVPEGMGDEAPAEPALAGRDRDAAGSERAGRPEWVPERGGTVVWDEPPAAAPGTAGPGQPAVEAATPPFGAAGAAWFGEVESAAPAEARPVAAPPAFAPPRPPEGATGTVSPSMSVPIAREVAPRGNAFDDEPVPTGSGGVARTLATLAAIAVIGLVIVAAYVAFTGFGAAPGGSAELATVPPPAGEPGTPPQEPAAGHAPELVAAAEVPAAGHTPELVAAAEPPAAEPADAPAPSTAPAGAAPSPVPSPGGTPAPESRRAATSRAAPRVTGRPAAEPGWAAVERNDLPAAYDYFSKALQSDPRNAFLLYGRGYVSEKLGDPASAGDDYCAAIGVGSTDSSFLREVESGLKRTGRACG